MDIDQNLNDRKRDEVWIISGGSFVNLDLSNICKESVSGPVTEYRISALAHYLLNPNPIMVEEKINGCKVKYLKPSSGKIKRLIRKIIPQKDDPSDDNNNFVEEIISNSKLGIPSFHDEGLNSHFLKIKELLKPYDPVQKKLSGLDREKIEDITAICDEIGGHRYLLNLKGSVKEKIDFVMNSISKKVRVSFNKAYLLNGLFELRGFKFESYNSNSHYVLIKFTQNNQTRYCVLNADYKFEFWVNDNILVNYIHLFEQSVKTDPKLKESLNLNLNNGEKMAIANALNNFQNVVFFNFFPTSGNSRRKVITNISVMHDFRALEQIKSQLPQLYSEIDKKASVSEAGKLYLLDSFRGYQNV
jgi:hypothetical protein